MSPDDLRASLGLRTVYRQSFDLVGRNAPAILMLVIAIGWLPRLAIEHLPLHSLFPGRWDAATWYTELAVACLRIFLTELLLICVVHTVLANKTGVGGSLRDTAIAASRRLLRLVPITLVLDWPALISTLAKLQYSPMLGGAAQGQNPFGYITLWFAVSLVASFWIILWVGVAGAVFIEESLPVTSTLARAARLLSRQRWRFFRIWFPFAIFEIFLTGAMSFSAGLFHASILAMAERSLGMIGLVTSLTSAFWAVLISVCYRELRRMKDGSTVEIAEVFD